MAPCPALHLRDSRARATSSFFRAPAPSCADRVRFDHSGVLMPVDTARDSKRRRRGGGQDDDSRASKKQAVGRVASPAAHFSCARTRPFVRASRLKDETMVTARAVVCDAHDVIRKRNTGESISCKKIEPAVPAPASRPEKETSSSTQLSARTVAHGVITKQKVEPSGGRRDNMKAPCAGVLRKDGAIKTKQEAGVRVQATATTSMPPRSHPASAMKVSSASVLRNEAHGVIMTKQVARERVQAIVTKSIQQIRPTAPAANHQDPHAAQEAVRAALAVARQARDRRQQNVYRQQREEARRELDKVVRTVFFNDPYITFEDALKP